LGLEGEANMVLSFSCLDTLVEEGEIPVRLDPSGKVLEKGRRRETREFDGRTFLMETALTGDVAIIRAWKADKAGNCVFR
jgi:3-oxoacid CoA-transferase